MLAICSDNAVKGKTYDFEENLHKRWQICSYNAVIEQTYGVSVRSYNIAVE